MTKLAIVLDLPAPVDRALETEGIVIRCEAQNAEHNDFKVAIIFTKLSDDNHKTIREYVEHDLAQDGPDRG